METKNELEKIVNDIDLAIVSILEKYPMSAMELGAFFVARLTRACQEVGDGSLFVQFCNDVQIPKYLEKERKELH